MPTILFADDNKEVRKLIGMLLPHYGYTVHLAENGQEAVETVAEQPVDLILLDIDMPVLDGLSACRQIKRLPDRNRIPVLFVSGSYLPQSINEIYDAGGDGLVPKPFDMHELVDAIKDALAQASLPV